MNRMQHLAMQSATSRASMRRRVYLPGEVVMEDGFWRISSTILDVSTTGLLAECWADVPVGARTFVAFRAPDSQQWIDGEAWVTRLLGGRRRGDQTRAIALQFDDLDNISKAILSAKLAGLPPPVPSRPLRSRLDYAEFVRSAAFSTLRRSSNVTPSLAEYEGLDSLQSTGVHAIHC